MNQTERVGAGIGAFEEALERHRAKRDRIAADLRREKASGRVSFRRRSVSHVVPKHGDLSTAGAPIDVSDLNEILWIDPERKTCVAEAGVTFVDLVNATLPHSLAPIVVPELETITVGGAVAGCSLESTSFEVGGFHDTCIEYEVLTAQGEVITCRPDGAEALLFQMVHGTFGTLGLITLVELRLTEAKPWVHVRYERSASLAEHLGSVARHARQHDVTFMDGILHAPDLAVLAVGRFVDRAPYSHRYDWMRVYWESTAHRGEDYLATRDYFFRYDHGVTNTHPRSFLGRLLLGRFLHSSQLLRLAHGMSALLPIERPRITLDLLLPLSRVPEFMRWYDRAIGHYPLWCVPYARVRDYEWIADDYLRGLEDDLFIDLAIYGAKQPPGRNQYVEIEHELARVQGIKTLISYNYFDEESFWNIWNKSNYDRVKKRTDPKGLFGDLYEKTCLLPRGVVRGG